MSGEHLPQQDPSYLTPGTQVGEWRVVCGRGRGSSGAVYLVVRVGHESGEPFALKIALSPQDARFEREVQLLSRVRPGHVPRLVSTGVWRGANGAEHRYFVMDWIPGEPLYLWAERHKPTEQEMLTALAQVTRGMAAVHALQAIHREIKGDNVLVAPGDRAVLMDFGSCWYPGARRLTGQREPVGTPEYWSPEALTHQWKHRRHSGQPYQAGPADDVYALGVTAYRLVVGACPPEVLEELGHVGRRRPVAPEELVTVSPGLALLLRLLLSDDSAARGRAERVAEAFERVAKGAGRRAKRPHGPRAGGGGKGGGAAALGASSLLEDPRGHGDSPAGGSAARVWGAARVESSTQLHAIAEAAQARHTDEGKAALAQGALTEWVGARNPETGASRVSAEMPKKPLPGQRHPPCGKYEIELQGGCWIGPPNAVPPCGDGAYEWQHQCYWPVYPPGRPTASEPS